MLLSGVHLMSAINSTSFPFCSPVCFCNTHASESVRNLSESIYLDTNNLRVSAPGVSRNTTYVMMAIFCRKVTLIEVEAAKLANTRIQ